MPQQTKIFRVFVSSTFSDMKEERWILQKEVFPELEKFCESRGARFQGVDLRWGVSENLSLNQKTLQTCFNEIARCQKKSPKPNFLILLGDRYGWQPVPEKIPISEMQTLLTHFLEEEKKFLIWEPNNTLGWYRLDENAKPFEYLLQPKGKYEKHDDWKPIEIKIREILRNTIRKICQGNEDAIKEKWTHYFTSATHQEIIKGALKHEDGENPEDHVLAFVRKIDGRPEGTDAEGFVDLVDGIPDDYCKNQLNELKDALKSKLKKNCIHYYTNWEDGKSKMSDDYRKEFKDKIINFLTAIIDPLSKTIEGNREKHELDYEIKLHKDFKERLVLHFKGRLDDLTKLRELTENKSGNKPISLIGVSGSGKSSVMAKTIDSIDAQKNVVIYRFIGATSRSTNIMSLLQSVCSEIAEKFGRDAKTMAREGDDKAWYDMNGLSEIFKECLELAKPERPIIVFLDALDQLSDTDNAKLFYWLPKDLRANSKLILSALTDLKDKLSETEIIPLPSLPESDAKDILDGWLDVEKRNLTDAQKQKIISNFNQTGEDNNKSGLPIYLKLAFEIAKHWRSYENEYSLQKDVKGIINDYFKFLESEHDIDFVRTAICYMLSGRYQGLAENEILEILAFTDTKDTNEDVNNDEKDYWTIFLEKNQFHKQDLIALKEALEKPKEGPRGYMKIPIAVWSRLYLDLEPFLTERDADGVPIITFFHRQFNEVLRERYELMDEKSEN